MPKYETRNCDACDEEYRGRFGSKFCSRYCFERNPQLVDFIRGADHWNFDTYGILVAGNLEKLFSDDINWIAAYRFWRKEYHGSYVHFHSHIAKLRGKPYYFICECCEVEKACEWSWLHDTDFRDTDNYVPLCTSCHRNYDRTY